MQVIPRCRNLLILRKHLHFPSSTQFASFHSTPFCEEKWKNKWKPDFERGQPPPSKSSAQYRTRRGRADAKRAIKTLLSHDEVIDVPVLGKKVKDSIKTDTGGHSKSSSKRGQKQYNAHQAEKIHNHRMRRKFRKGHLFEDEDDHPETFFEARQATFGDTYYTWSFNGRSSRRSNPGFDWRKTFRRASGIEEDSETTNKPDFEDELYTVGSRTDRLVLGLPLVGPLKMEDVKTAFHLSALKWHPDKHQGPMQAEAAEKFKICVSSYKSLCSALSEI